jgi:hypothetical protein
MVAMMLPEIQLDDILRLRKPHPLTRRKLARRLKKVIKPEDHQE